MRITFARFRRLMVACALTLHRDSFSLALVKETVSTIISAGGKAEARQVDVSDAASVKSAIDHCISKLGGLHYAFNNAGISGSPFLVENIPLEEFDKIVKTNLYGAFYCMKYQLAHMAKQGFGVIVNTASTAGMGATPLLTPYTASKHGIVGLTRNAAVDYARKGVRVNVVCPGTTLTPMLQNLLDHDPKSKAKLEGAAPIGRLATPEELANVAIFLCSDEASYVTGVVLPVDGAMTAGFSSGMSAE